jgi:hypothetical protein
LDYHGSTTKIEYTADKPNPVLHPGLYNLYDTNGSKVGEFWTEPQKSYSGCISDLETEGGGGNSSNYTESTTSRNTRPQKQKPQGTAEWVGFFIALAISPYIDLFATGFWTKYTAERRDWWSTLGRTILFGIVAAIIIFGIGGGDTLTPIIVYLVLTLLPLVVVTFSRVRDAGKPWWLALIPGANVIISAFFPSEY